MLKHMVRWIVILATLLIIATALVMTPLMSHAAGVTKPHTTHTTTTTPTPAPGGITPDYGWGM